MIDEVVNIALGTGMLNGDLQIEPYLDCIRSHWPDEKDQGSNTKLPPLRFHVQKRQRKPNGAQY